MTAVTVRITPAQAAVLDLGRYGSEAMGEAQDAGVTWTRTVLTVPDTAAARAAIGLYIGFRADIAYDNLAYGAPGDFTPADRGEYRATLNLAKAARAAGLATEHPYEPLEVGA